MAKHSRNLMYIDFKFLLWEFCKQNDLFSQFKQTASTHKGLEKRRK